MLPRSIGAVQLLRGNYFSAEHVKSRNLTFQSQRAMIISNLKKNERKNILITLYFNDMTVEPETTIITITYTVLLLIC